MTTTDPAIPARKLVVTGATGFVGSQLVAMAKSKGIATLPVVRSVEKAKRLGIDRWLLFEEFSRQKLAQTGFDSSTVVHLIVAVRHISAILHSRTG